MCEGAAIIVGLTRDCSLLRISSGCDQVVPVFVPVVATRSSNVKDDAAFRYCTPARHPLDPMSVTAVNRRND